MTSEDYEVTRAKIISRAWSDDGFRSALINDPRAALSSLGIDVPADKTIVVHEDSADTVNFVIPNRPTAAELSETDLENVAAGAGLAKAPPWSD